MRSSNASRTRPRSLGSSIGAVGVARGDAGERALVVAALNSVNLSPLRRRDHDHALVGVDRRRARRSLMQRRQRDAGVRAGEHAGAIGARRGVGELVLGRLLDDAVVLLAACGSPCRRSPGCRSGSRARASAAPCTGSNCPSRACRRGRAGWRARPARRTMRGSLRDEAERPASSRSRRRARSRCRGCRPG